MSVWIKDREKSLETNLKKNANSIFKRQSIHNTNTKEIIVTSSFTRVFIDIIKIKSTVLQNQLPDKLINIDQYCYCQFVLKFLRKLFTTLISNSQTQINYYKITNLGFAQATLVCIINACNAEITHEFYKTFDADTSLQLRGVFLDLSKAFGTKSGMKV